MIQMTDRETINLPADSAAVIESMRSIGYSFHDAVADVADNSVSAGAENIDVMCDYDCAVPFLSIFDDGCGMDDAELKRAMTYGSKNPNQARSKDDLGRYGLGLKVASLSQCAQLTVLSKKNGKISAYEWNLQEIRRSNTTEWPVIVVDPDSVTGMQMEKLRAAEHGTLVIWRDFDVLMMGSDSISSSLRLKLHDTRDHLALVFHRFIKKAGPMSDARDVTFRVNEVVLKSRDPFLTDNSYTIPKVSESIPYHGKTIQIKGYILPHINQLTPEEIESLGGKGRMQSLQGFYIYRNKRLILAGGTWFKMSGKKQLQNLARVLIDIPNDMDVEWSVDVKKSSMHMPEDFKNKLKPVLKDVLETSTRVYTRRGKKAIGAGERMIVRVDHKDYVTYEINRDHPLMRHLLENPEVSHEFSTIISMLEHSIPYDEIRNDFEQKLKPNSLTDEELDQYLQMAIVRIQMTGEDAESLQTLEPFCNYPQIIDKLKEKGY